MQARSRVRAITWASGRRSDASQPIYEILPGSYNRTKMMPMSKKYLHDKLVLLLLSANIFLGFISTILIFLRLNVGQGGEGYIVEYRSNLGISAFKTGNITTILSFVGFILLTVILAILLSIRTYRVRRELALGILMLSGLLLILSIIISNALMVLH